MRKSGIKSLTHLCHAWAPGRPTYLCHVAAHVRRAVQRMMSTLCPSARITWWPPNHAIWPLAAPVPPAPPPSSKSALAAAATWATLLAPGAPTTCTPVAGCWPAASQMSMLLSGSSAASCLQQRLLALPPHCKACAPTPPPGPAVTASVSSGVPDPTAAATTPEGRGYGRPTVTTAAHGCCCCAAGAARWMRRGVRSALAACRPFAPPPAAAVVCGC